jgi:hypothetical protein
MNQTMLSVLVGLAPIIWGVLWLGLPAFLFSRLTDAPPLLKDVSRWMVIGGLLGSAMLALTFTQGVSVTNQCLQVTAWQYDSSGGSLNPAKIVVITTEGDFWLRGDEATTVSAIVKQNGAGWYRADIIGVEEFRATYPRSLRQLRPDHGCAITPGAS